MANVPDDKRQAAFVCCIAVAYPAYQEQRLILPIGQWVLREATLGLMGLRGKAQRSVTEEEIAARMAATANMQDGDVGRPKDGAPFKAKIAAIGHASKAGLKDTHQVVQLGTDQYVLRPKAEEEDDGAPAAAKPPENIPQNIPESLTAQASAPAEEPVTVAPATPEAPGAAIPPQPETPPQQGGFDSDKFNKEREQRIAESRAAGNVHLDKLSPDVETMRGRSIYYVHDPKVRGTVRTVANTGEVVVNWSDQYSADKEMASEKQDGKKKVWQSWLMPSDLKDYAVAQAEAPSTPQPVTNQAPAGEQVVPEKQKKGGKAKTLGGRVIGDRVTSDVGEGTVVGFDGDQRLIVKKDDGETYYVPPAFAYDPGTPLPEEFDDAEPPKAEAPAAAPAKEEASKESGVVSISQELLATASDRNNAMRLGEAEYKKRVAGVKVFQHKGQDYVTVGSTGMGGGTVEVTAYNLVPVGTHKGNSPKWSYTGRRVKVGSKEFELGQPTNFVGPSGKSAVEIAQEKRDQEAKAAAASQEDDTTSDEGDDDRYGNRDRFKVGDRVVLEGTDRLRAGAKVRVIGAPGASGSQNNSGQRPTGAPGTARP